MKWAHLQSLVFSSNFSQEIQLTAPLFTRRFLPAQTHTSAWVWNKGLCPLCDSDNRNTTIINLNTWPTIIQDLLHVIFHPILERCMYHCLLQRALVLNLYLKDNIPSINVTSSAVLGVFCISYQVPTKLLSEILTGISKIYWYFIKLIVKKWKNSEFKAYSKSTLLLDSTNIFGDSSILLIPTKRISTQKWKWGTRVLVKFVKMQHFTY